ncbi:MAG: type II secretion system protein, partial [Planctomycetota bacterium]
MRTHQRHGFTLIELLVVISILALLAAMLMPAIANAQKGAQQTTDGNNVKQMMTTLISWRSENKGKTYPVLASRTDGDGGLTPDQMGIGDGNAITDPTTAWNLSAHIFYHLANNAELGLGSFNSPVYDGLDSITDVSDFTGSSYAIDWSAPSNAGSIRPVVANNMDNGTTPGNLAPDPFGTGSINVAFGDGHMEPIEVVENDDGTYSVENPAVEAADDVLDDIFTITGDENADRMGILGRGDRKTAFIKV